MYLFLIYYVYVNLYVSGCLCFFLRLVVICLFLMCFWHDVMYGLFCLVTSICVLVYILLHFSFFFFFIIYLRPACSHFSPSSFLSMFSCLSTFSPSFPSFGLIVLRLSSFACLYPFFLFSYTASSAIYTLFHLDALHILPRKPRPTLVPCLPFSPCCLP